MQLESNMHRQSIEFEQAQAHFAAQLHREEFIKAHPEYLSYRATHATTFRARCGKRPSFATSAEQVAYERGFNDFPSQPWGLPDSPAMQGYLDAELMLAERLESRDDRRVSDFAELQE
jgi:hypothetical protein